MPAIRRLSDAPYRWDIIEAPLSEVANQEKLLPPDFISADGFGITEAARRYLAPLIVGEAYPPFKNGLPDYVKLQNVAAPKETEHCIQRLKTATSLGNGNRQADGHRALRSQRWLVREGLRDAPTGPYLGRHRP